MKIVNLDDPEGRHVDARDLHSMLQIFPRTTLLALLPRLAPAMQARPEQSPLFVCPLFAARTLNATGQSPGHAIAAVRALKSSLQATGRRKGG